MARRYVCLYPLENGDKVGFEVRAKTEATARQEACKLLEVAYPAEDTFNAPIRMSVSRLKEKGGIWQPVKAYMMGVLPGVTTWIAPKDVEMTDICVSNDNVLEFPLVPKEEKKVKKCQSFTETKPSKWKDIKLGITEAVLKEMAHSVLTYENNEVKSS